MRVVDKRTKLSRRGFLKGSGAATVGLVALSVGTGWIASPDGAWAVGAKTLKPTAMQTLVQMARDIYPHDQIADRFYAFAVASYDEKAATDGALKTLIEDGIASLDALAQDKHKSPTCMVRPCVARGFGALVLGLASMYPASVWSDCSGPSWISARARSH